jgi:hypothetical protein
MRKRQMAKKANEKVINFEAIYAPYFSEVDGKALQQVMDFVGYGEDTQNVYVRKNGEWLEPEEGAFEYPYMGLGDGEYTPGDFNSIEEEVYEEALELWDNSQKDGQTIYSKQFFPYLLENYEGTIEQEEDED